MEAFMENVNNTSTSIKNGLPATGHGKKLLDKGAETLSDAELIAILFLITARNRRVLLNWRGDLLSACNNSLHDLGKRSLADLKRSRALVPPNPYQLLPYELGRRREGLLPAGKTVVRSSGEIAGYFKSILWDLSTKYSL